MSPLAPLSPLSPIERRVLALRAEGRSWAETARECGISVNAVISAIGRICMAADAPTEAAAIRKLADDVASLEPIT